MSSSKGNKDSLLLSGLRTALDHVPSFVYVKNRKLEYVYANIQTLKLFECTMEELYLASDGQFFPPETAQKIKENDLKALSGESTEIELIVNDGSANKRIYLSVNTPVYSDTNHIIGVLGISTDITTQKELAEKAIKLAKTDVLTGLVNRLELDSKLNQEIQRYKRDQEPLSIILADLDHFKTVNDDFGHLAGDKCLVQVAKIFGSHSRIVDTAGRWGGEEFLILCPQADLKSAIAQAETYRSLIHDHIFPEVKHVTASLGVTTFQPNDTLETFVDRADQALYKAKSLGRNRVEAL
ncbi:sensor domain-containing diguanylate cyclase [Vibrio renipiscarius]|uniref:sensor domain-containing diguanylate cyclase n=1 Tax=Vibrio renipiscarius TaxID=1461322 RepID=UPI00069A8112|nr:GGDEF domain-containing protein [Vibrio renipiscarius]